MVRHEIWLHGFPIPGATVATAKWAEAQGFDGLLLADSQNLVGDPYIELGVAGHATTRLKLGTGCTNPVTRHPTVTVAAIATLQVESGGRAELGVARGDSALAQIGLAPPSVADFATFLDRVQGLLRGKTVEFDHGPSRIGWIATAGQPKVPLNVAATGHRIIVAAAGVADQVTFTLGADTDRLRAAIALARQTQTSARPDKPLSLGAFVNVAVHPNIAIARDLVRGSVGIFAHFLAMPGGPAATLPPADRTVVTAVGRTYEEARHGLRAASQSAVLTDEFIDRFAVVGPTAHCRERLTALLALGLDRIVIVPGSRDADKALLAEANERFAADVLAALREA